MDSPSSRDASGNMPQSPTPPGAPCPGAHDATSAPSPDPAANAAPGTAGAATSPQAALPIALRVNGRHHTLAVEPWVTLLDLLRDRLDLTGSKKGCDQGQCGACTVLVDGRRINACLALAVMQDGADITTVEGLPALAGLPDDGSLHPLQQAFIDHDALQCGYCTPGQLCSAVGLQQEGHANNVAQVKELMSGNICRCGAYPQITAAVAQVVLQRRTTGVAA